MSKKVFLKIFSCIFTLLFCQSYVNANPIPVFCMAGWLDKYPNCGKENSYIIERDPSSRVSKSRYDLYSSYIIERDPSSRVSKSRYDLYPSYIIERDPSSRVSKNRYDLYPSYIIERDPSSGVSKNRYDLY